MGFNTVAVIYNDFTGYEGRSFAEMDRAIRGWSARHRGADANFGFGQVVSQDYADYEQVVIVSRNTGVTAHEATSLTWYALIQMQQCLERHGYKVTKPYKRAKKAGPSDAV